MKKLSGKNKQVITAEFTLVKIIINRTWIFTLNKTIVIVTYIAWISCDGLYALLNMYTYYVFYDFLFNCMTVG